MCAVKESACQCRRLGRLGFNLWVREIFWRRKWQPTPVFLPGKSHGPRSLVGYIVHGATESDTMEHTHTHTHTHTTLLILMDFLVSVGEKILDPIKGNSM